MQRPPWSELPARPITAGTMLAAIALSLARWGGVDVGRLLMSLHAFEGEPHRLVTSIFLHGDGLHLLFNLYWLWVFGAYIERAFGSLRWAGLLLSSAAVSGAAQYALSGSGIGLSGVGYASFGFSWMLSRYDPEHRSAMDTGTVRLFLIWGLFCIAATALDVMAIANVAHGVGFVFGALSGLFAAKRTSVLAAVGATGLVALVALTVVAVVYRPELNWSEREPVEHCYEGYVALTEHRNAFARRVLDQAARYPKTSADCWINVGVARGRTGGDADAAYRRANALRGQGGASP